MLICFGFGFTRVLFGRCLWLLGCLVGLRVLWWFCSFFGFDWGFAFSVGLV